MSEIDYGIAVVIQLAWIFGLSAGIWIMSEPERKRFMSWLRERRKHD